MANPLDAIDASEGGFPDDDGGSVMESESGVSTAETDSGNNFTKDLVRKDNRMVTLVRAMVILVLLSAATVTTYMAYKVTSDAEHAAFVAAHESVGSKLAPGFVTELNLRLWQAGSIAATLEALMQTTGVAPHVFNMDQEVFEAISKEVRWYSRAITASWNPILRDDQERAEFEAMAKAQFQLEQQVEQEDYTCDVCGSSDLTILNPDFLIELPGYGKVPCSSIEDAGDAGLISFEECVTLPPFLEDNGCFCGPREGDSRKLQTSGEGSGNVTLLGMEDDFGGVVPLLAEQAPYMPYWTFSSVLVKKAPLLVDHMSSPHRKEAATKMMATHLPSFSSTILRTGNFFEDYTTYPDETSATLYFPVKDATGENIVGSVAFEMIWSVFLTSVIPRYSDLTHIVIENTCGKNFTYTIEPEQQILVLLGDGGDLHDPAFESTVISSTYEEFAYISPGGLTAPAQGDEAEDERCLYRFHIYATEELAAEFITKKPFIFGCITAGIFLFTSVIFLMYDCLVRRAQRKVVDSAENTTALVSSLFPKNVRDRMLQQVAEEAEAKAKMKSGDAPMRMTKVRMQNFLSGGDDELGRTKTFASEPIADLFASATVMFLDIASFTAWSSEREPSQVFVLLETVYQSFDEIASKLSVFKVETIGDSYVAVCGLPTRRVGHAPIMAKFARRCLSAMNRVAKDLEVRLGPSTGDLQARVGLHSGPVTAGVLRGEKARFQLFGDTVNTAARLESAGQPGHIHASQETVDLLEKAGKGHWALKRPEVVTLKGKGELQTYFLKPAYETSDFSSKRSDVVSSTRFELDSRFGMIGNRLIDWNTEVLMDFLKRIVAHRPPSQKGKHVDYGTGQSISSCRRQGDPVVLDELTEALSLPSEARNTSGSAADIQMPKQVKPQLRTYVRRISESYRDIPFHNFEHCSHVLMSTSKLMKRIVVPDDIDYKQTDDQVAHDIHRSTYGISSDPILQFASLFAALIHDVDHTGLTNAELVEGKAPVAEQYRNQSMAEQNSIDVAWRILMEPGFKDLRRSIAGSEAGMCHFRQLVVNAVLATDIADKQLKMAREKRWAETFPEDDNQEEQFLHREEQVDRDRKATIVFEYIIQASDVCHTMQHWHTYQKFNKRLFEERYVAWLQGSLKKEPSLGWYGGELWFFDNYIIPLANKLDKCGVFGVSYHEYLTYAKENRKEWVVKGKEIVEEMKEFCDTKYSGTLEDSNIILEGDEDEEE